MSEKKDFLILRYSLVEEPQYAIGAEKLPVPKGAAVLVSLLGDREFQLNGVRYSFVGFAEVRSGNSHPLPPNRYYIGKMAKLKQTHVGKKIPGDILETREDDWLPVLTIVDVKDQYVFVRRDYRFGTPEQIMRALQGGLREPILARFNHRAFVEGCTRKEHFWEVVSEHKRFYKFELHLISPNILETNLRARDALAAMKDLFGQDQVTITLNNESGDLTVPKDPVSDYLEYIEEGEGSWSLTTEGSHGGKKTFSSSDNIDTAEATIPLDRSLPEDLQIGLDGIENARSRLATDASMIKEIVAKLEKAS